MINKLLEATKKAKCRWITSEESDKFSIDIAHNVINIDKYVPYDSSPLLVVFQLFNKDGQLIDNIAISEDEGDYKLLSSLHDAARDNALKISETIKEIMEGLNNL